jgi:tRNA(Ile)-lysidine synthase
MQQELNVRAPQHIAETAEKLQQVQAFIERMTDRAASGCISRESADVILDLPVLEAQDPLIRQELLRRALELCGGLKDIGSVHIDALLTLAQKDCGKSICLPGGLRAIREHRTIRLTRAVPEPPPKQEVELLVPGECRAGSYRIRAELFENTPQLMEQICTEKKYTKWLSYDTINHKIVFRTRRPGDYLIVNAQGGRKKMKDYLIDLKIPREKRDQLWMLADGSHILWVVGYRISEAAKVHSETRTAIKLQMEEISNEGKSQNSFAGTGSKSADCRGGTADQQGL